MNAIDKIDTLITIGEAAQALNFHGPDGKPLGRNKVFDILRDHGVLLCGQSVINRPSQQYVDAGYFVIRMKRLGNGELKPVPFLTEKGLGWLGRYLSGLGYARIQGGVDDIVIEQELFDDKAL